MPEWTKEQLAAINASGGAVIVSAAAGSGKTAVLIEKLKRMLTDEENPVPAENIIVVTFTNDAAAQMKQRLNEALTIELEKNPGSELIAKQLELLPKAKISTISSFCLDLIRDNIGSVEADPGFRIADQNEEQLIVQKALDEIIEEQLAPNHTRNSEITALLDFFSPNQRSVKRLSSIVTELREKIVSQPFCEEYLDSFTRLFSQEPESHPLYEYYISDTRKQLNKALWAAQELSQLLDRYMAPEYKKGKNDNPYDKMCRELSFVMKYLEKVIEHPEEGYRTPIFVDSSGSKVFGTFTSTKIKSPEIQERCKALRGMYKSILSGGAKNPPANTPYSPLFADPEEIKEDMSRHAEYCALLSNLLKELDERVRRIKSEKNVLGFSDAERLAVSLLCKKKDGVIQKSALAKELSEYYNIIMIDEFQDSNKIQSLIFNLLSKDGTAENAGQNLFAVGDVKQSIYRFRNAEPEIFLSRLAASVPCDTAADGENRSVLLTKNFRSSKGVVDYVNDVFDAVMSEEIGGVRYDGSHRLVKGSCIEGSFPAEIIFSDYEKGDEDKGASREAKAVALRIKRLINENPEIKPTDICLLFRSRKYMPVFATALAEEGIPASSDSTSSLLASREVTALINLLRAVDNASADVPIAAALMSDMFMLSAENITEARLMPGSTLYAVICECAKKSSRSLISEELYGKAVHFCSVFSDIRRYAASSGMEQLVRYIYDRTDYLPIISVYPDGALRKANLLLTAKLAAQYDSNGGTGLSGFIRQLTELKEKGSISSAAPQNTSADGCVILKTIHSSKGLEYPYIFLCRLNTEFSYTDSRSPLIFSADYGIAFNISDSSRFTTYESFPHKIMKSIKRAGNINEEMMLLYVAMTRAKNKLFAAISSPSPELPVYSGKYGRSDGLFAYEVSHASSMQDWLCCALCGYTLENLENGKRRYVSPENIIEISEPLADNYFSDQQYLPEQTAADAGTQTDKSSPANTDALNHAAALFEQKLAAGRRYSFTASITPAKLSVSEIAKNHGYSAVDARIVLSERKYRQKRVPYIKIPDGMSAAEVGTAVHEFMQHADLRQTYAAPLLYDGIRRQAELLGNSGILTAKQAKCAAPEVIAPFFATELWHRIEKSDEILRERKFLVKICDLMLDDYGFEVYNGTEGMLQGVADCLFREPDGWVLIDYKTDRRVSDEILIKRYKKQIILYARAFSLILDMPVKEAFIYSFALGKEIPVDIGPQPSCALP